MSSGLGRPVRYVLFAIFAITAWIFLSSSSIPLPDSPRTDTKLPPAIVKEPSTVKEPTGPIEKSNQNETPLSKVDTVEPSHKDTPAPASKLVNATFVTLARNSDIWEMVKSIRHVEDRFNRNYHYDWVFLNDQQFDDTFKKVTTALVSGKTHYGVIPEEQWGFPEWIDQEKAKKVRESMAEHKIIYGDSISYRHMCRYESGFFFRHELLQQFEYYWRVEPSIELYCDIGFDPFRLMKDQKKKYGFVVSLYEYYETIPTLWNSVLKFMENHPEHIAEDNSMGFVSDDGGKTYNKCHFWSNFEIGNLDWLRSQAYIDYFTALDQDGGFFYERWGDAPVHSIAAALMLKKEEIHFFNEIGYYHVPFTHCPTGEKLRLDLKCSCNPSENFDWNGYSCTSRYFEINNREKPEGHEKEQG